MIELLITDKMLLVARKKARDMGELNNSITKGVGNLVGFLGEEVAKKALASLGSTVIHSNTYDYDLVVGDVLIDVKTKSTSVKPLPHYSCSITSFNTKQRCSHYAFVRVKKDLTVGWWCGVYSKEDYFKDAVFMKKGDVDPDNNYIVKSDCYNLPIEKLKECL